MPRFRNTLNGVVVEVDEDTAEGLGAAYESAEAKPARAAAAKKRPAKTDDD